MERCYYGDIRWKSLSVASPPSCSGAFSPAVALFLGRWNKAGKSVCLRMLDRGRCTTLHIQLFRESLSEKVHATIPKGIVSGYEFTVFQRNLKEWHERPWTYVCEWKVQSIATVSEIVYWSYPILLFGIVAWIVFPTMFLEIAVYQPLFTSPSGDSFVLVTFSSEARICPTNQYL